MGGNRRDAALIAPLKFRPIGPNFHRAERLGQTFVVEHVADRRWRAAMSERLVSRSTVTRSYSAAVAWCNDRAWSQARIELAARTARTNEGAGS